MAANRPSIGLNVLSFFIPLVGIILYFVYKNDAPLRGKSALTWALISMGIGLLIRLIIAAS